MLKPGEKAKDFRVGLYGGTMSIASSTVPVDEHFARAAIRSIFGSLHIESIGLATEEDLDYYTAMNGMPHNITPR